MVKVKPAPTFRDVQLTKTFCVSGGMTNSPHALSTRTMMYRGVEHNFMRLRKDDKWLRHVVGGAQATRTTLMRTTIISTLSQAACGLDPSHDDADHRDGGAGTPAEVDPMESLIAKKKVVQKKTRVPSGRPVRRVVEVELPEHCAEKFPDDTGTTRRVTLYCHTKSSVWLSLEDLQWFVSYVKEQHALGGVPNQRKHTRDGGVRGAAAAGPRPRDAAAPASVGWNFCNDVWEVTKPTGAGKGEKRTLCPHSMSPADITTLGLSDAEYSAMSYADKKDAAHQCLHIWANAGA
jgi:hypothetical protein